MGNWDVSKPNKDGEPGEDAISRADAEALFRNARGELHKSAIRNEQNGHPIKDLPTRDLMLLNAEQMIHLLPPVTPKQRTGKWQEVYAETDYRNGWIEFSCENCEYQHGLESGEYGWSYGDPIPWKYCPICGARMVEPQESEG